MRHYEVNLKNGGPTGRGEHFTALRTPQKSTDLYRWKAQQKAIAKRRKANKRARKQRKQNRS